MVAQGTSRASASAVAAPDSTRLGPGSSLTAAFPPAAAGRWAPGGVRGEGSQGAGSRGRGPGGAETQGGNPRGVGSGEGGGVPQGGALGEVQGDACPRGSRQAALGPQPGAQRPGRGCCSSLGSSLRLLLPFVEKEI